MTTEPTIQQIKILAWFEGYWAAGEDYEYDTNTPCPYGEWDVKAMQGAILASLAERATT